MRKSAWTPPTPTVETAHDVRRLSVCAKCGHLGSDLLRAHNLFENKKKYVHAYCLISGQEDGWEVFSSMPVEEIGKITLSEWKALGIPYETIDAALRVAQEREKRAARSAGKTKPGAR